MRLTELVGHIRSASNISILIGAGASRSAGIPTATELVEIIENRFGHCVASLPEGDRTNYGKMMAALAPADRKRLIEPLLEGAKLNWGHIALARIVQETEVRRILSFNFDFLMERATALLGKHLPVYDFGVSPSRHIVGLADKAIFHLHGQSYGMTLLNTVEETSDHADKLRPLLSDSLRNHLTIVCGYSGEADSAFPLIVDSFDSNNNLIWLGHSKEPKPHLRQLLDKPYAYYIGECDFDRTMIEIAKGIGCWPIPLISNPPGHAMELLELLPEFPVGEAESANVLKETTDRLKKISGSWSSNLSAVERAAEDLISGRVINRRAKVSISSATTQELRAWALINKGNRLLGEARNNTPDMRKSNLEAAKDSFEKAMQIWPARSNSYFGLGMVRELEAQKFKGKTKAKFLAAARDMYLKGLDISPDNFGALVNLGNIFLQEAEISAGSGKNARYKAAIERYETALRIAPNAYEALDNLGNALMKLAQLSKGDEAASLYQRAEDVLEKVAVITGKGTYNRACLLALTGQTSKAIEELKRCRDDRTLPEFSHVSQDSDLRALKEMPEYMEFLESLKGIGGAGKD